MGYKTKVAIQKIKNEDVKTSVFSALELINAKKLMQTDNMVVLLKPNILMGKLQQDRDLYMSLFYIFYNSILGQGKFAKKYLVFDQPISHDFKGYKLNLAQFCDTFKVDREAIKYLARVKLIKSKFGFYLIKRSDSDFFFLN